MSWDMNEYVNNVEELLQPVIDLKKRKHCFEDA